MSVVEDYFQNSTAAARAANVGAMDDDPEQAARAVDLAEASGVPATAIYGDVDGFERDHKAQLGSQIISDNRYIADYLNSHPMAARLSHDDLGALDSASQRIGALDRESGLQHFRRFLGITGLAEVAFPGDPLTPYKDFGLSRPMDVQFAAENPKMALAARGIIGTVASPLIFGGQIASGFLNIVKEYGGRELASMFEHEMVRGDIKAGAPHDLVDIAEANKKLKSLTDATTIIDHYARDGQEPPPGAHPLIDKAKGLQAKEDLDVLNDALSESTKTATRDRSPEFYSNFVRSHVGNRELGINADAVRELYGDKAPAPDDGLLGWVPGLQDKLVAAELTGGDVRVSMADWLAHVEPEVAKQLQDHLRLREGGVTLEEAKGGEADPQEHIPEPLQATRGAAGLEPLFSIGDRKVTLRRKQAAEGSEQPKWMGDSKAHDFDILDNTGKPVGVINLSEQKGGKQLYVDNIQAGENKTMFDPNFLGPSAIRDIMKQIKAEFPIAFGPDGEGVTGHRASGARYHGKPEDYMPPTDVAMPKVKFDRGWADVPAARKLLSGIWEQMGKFEAYTGEARTPEMDALHQAIQEEAARIIPKQIDEVKTVGALREPGGERGKIGGVYQRSLENLPRVLIALDGTDPVGALRHEAIHHLRRYGFFNEPEWTTLTRAARDEGWLKKYGIDSKYGDLDNAAKLEEAVAEGFRNWRNGQDAGRANTVFQKLADFIDNIKRRFKELVGKDLSWEELFKDVDSGRVGSREGNTPLEERGLRPLYQISDEDRPAIPDPSGAKGEELRRQIDELSIKQGLARSHGKETEPEYLADAERLKDLRQQYREGTSQAFGLTQAQYEKYMKLIDKRNAEDFEAASKKALKDQGRRQTKEWKANAARVKDEVTSDLSERPDLMLDKLFAERKGELKLASDKLSDVQKQTLPKEYFRKDGIDPDDLAPHFGFTSGDALVERLAMVAQDRLKGNMTADAYFKRLVDIETEKRMTKEFGDLAANVVEEAKDQAISETQIDILHEEVLALGLKAGSEFPITKSQIAQWNKDVFDRTTVGSIKSQDYLNAAGKAGRATEDALLSGDFAEAFRQKQRQHNAVIQAKYARQYEKQRKQLDRTAKVFKKRIVDSVPQEWTNWIHDVMMKVGYGVNRSVQDLSENIARQSETSLADFKAAKEAESYGVRDLPIADFLMDPNFKKQVDELTVEQFRDLKNSIDTLVKQGRDEKKVLVQGEARDREAVLGEMREKLETFGYAQSKHNPGPIKWGVRAFFAGLTNMETLLNRWDRNDPKGIFKQAVIYPLAESANSKARLQRETAKLYGELGKIKDYDKLVDAPFPDPLSRTEANPEGDGWTGFSRKHVIAMLQNAGNKSNWTVLAKGYGANPVELMNWLVKNTTKEDWDRAQKLGNIFKGLFEKSNDVYENITGATNERIPLEPISHEHGDYAGWYHPLIADPIAKTVWSKDPETGVWTQKAQGKRDSIDDKYFFNASTANGYTKSRTGAIYPLQLSFDAVPSKLGQMVHDISFRQALLETEKVFSDRRFQEDVAKYYGRSESKGLMPYLQAIAGAEGINSEGATMASRFLEKFRQNVISTYIGFNPLTAFKHGPTALIMSARQVGVKDFADGVHALYLQSPKLAKEARDFVDENSDEIGRRKRHWQDTVAGQGREITGASNFRESMIEKASSLVAASDMFSARPTWWAAYQKAIADGEPHGTAVMLAEAKVRLAHGSTAETNRPGLVRGGGVLNSWMTSVYGFFGTVMQRQIEIAHKANDAFQLGREGEIKQAANRAPEILGDIMTYVVWPIVVEEVVTGQAFDDHKGLGRKVIEGALSGMASPMLYVRDLVHALISGSDPGVGMASSPLHDIKNAVNDLKKGREAFNKQHAGRTIGDLMTVAGHATGKAPKEIGNLARFGIDYANREAHPHGFGDWYRALTRGTEKKPKER